MLHLELGIDGMSRFRDDERVHLAEPEAARDPQRETIAEVAFDDLSLDDVDEVVGAARLSARARQMMSMV
jgi:hypothetical protein